MLGNNCEGPGGTVRMRRLDRAIVAPSDKKVIFRNVLAWSDVLSNGSGLVTAMRGRARLCECAGSTGPL